MCLNIRCDGESEKFYKIFWELNKTSVYLSSSEAKFFLALFSSPRNPKSFQNSLSHRILRHMHEALNIDENKN